ncbi:MAG: AAA family ATPase [Pseudomonadota bacterium]
MNAAVKAQAHTLADVDAAIERLGGKPDAGDGRRAKSVELDFGSVLEVLGDPEAIEAPALRDAAANAQEEMAAIIGDAEGDRSASDYRLAAWCIRRGIVDPTGIAQVVFSLRPEKLEEKEGAGLGEDYASRTTAKALARNASDPRPENFFEPLAEAAPSDAAPLRLPPFVWRDPAAMPPRDVLYPGVVRGYVFATFAPGGAAKSSVLIVESLAMASGRPLLGDKPSRPLRVAIFNGEDPREEIEKRILAAAMYHDVNPAEIEGRLFVWSGRDQPLKLAEETRKGIELQEANVAQLVVALRAAGIDVLVIDPLATIHSVSENDNTAMNAVVDLLRQIAHEAECALLLVHHASKGARKHSSEMGADQARGASALVDGVRGARHIVPLSGTEASQFKVPPGERWRYFHVETGKHNLAPRSSGAAWRRLVSVNLGNGTPEHPHGDSLGVVEAWQPPSADEEVSSEQTAAILRKLASGDWRENNQATKWAGYAVAEVLGTDLGPRASPERTPEQNAGRARVKALIDHMRGAGALKMETGKDAKGRPAEFLVPVLGELEEPSAPSALGCGESAEGAE